MSGVPSPKLVTCAACGGIVSRRAPRCPHCGEEWPGRQAEVPGTARRGSGLPTWQVALIVATVVAVVAGTMYLGSGSRDFVMERGMLAELLDDTEPVGSFALGEEFDDFELRGRPYGITSASRDGRDLGLGWVCLEDGLNVVLYLGGQFGGDEDRDIDVRYRFDARPPSPTGYWGLFGGHESAFLPMDLVHVFTADALAADSVTVRATDPYDGERVTAAFPLDGLDSLLRRLDGCAAGADSAVIEQLEVGPR